MDPGKKEGPRLGKAGDGHAAVRDGETCMGALSTAWRRGRRTFLMGWMWGRRERSADGVTKLLGLSLCGRVPVRGSERLRTRQV